MKPIGNPGDWITAADYPAGALWAKASGALAFTLKVDTTGKATDCIVTASSGNQLLDDTACQKLVERARFSPMLDKAGQPIAATYSSRVRWELPQGAGASPITPGHLTIGFDLDPHGKLSNCTEEGAANELLNKGFCDKLPAEMKPLPGSQTQAKWHIIWHATIDVRELP